MRRRYYLGTVIGLCLFAGGCSGGAPPATSGAVPGDYVIGPGDTLNVIVYQNPALSVEAPVRPDGKISIPLESDLVALGETPSQLEAEIEKRLAKYVTQPHVTVIVNSFSGPLNDQIKVIGEVAQPLAVPYKAQMSVLDLVILSKGLTRFAAGNRAVIVRQGPDGLSRYSVRLDDLLKDGDISQNVAVRPGDTLFVPQAWF